MKKWMALFVWCAFVMCIFFGNAVPAFAAASSESLDAKDSSMHETVNKDGASEKEQKKDSKDTAGKEQKDSKDAPVVKEQKDSKDAPVVKEQKDVKDAPVVKEQKDAPVEKDISAEEVSLPAKQKVEPSSDWAYYYNNDKRFPMVWRNRGVATYIDKSSLIVQKYAPPQYVIAITAFEAGDAGYGKVSNYRVERYFYNFERTEMYRDKHPGKNEWEFVSPNGSLQQEGYSAKCIGEAIYYLCYKLKFYGTYEWKTIASPTADPVGEYEKVFFDAFYDRL